MAKKISDLPAASSLSGADLVPIVQGGTTKKATASLFSSVPVPPQVVTVTTASRLMAVGDAGKYLRFTATGVKVVHFDPGEGYSIDEEYNIANRAPSGDLTLQSDVSYFTLNAPKGGTLVLQPGDTVTVKMVSGDSSGVDAADVFGSTSDV